MKTREQDFQPGISLSDIEVRRVVRGTALYDFKCKRCVFWLGGVECKRKVFIPYVGASTANCMVFEEGRRCRHCGRMT